MAVRNFWLVIEVDGKRTVTSCGPQAAGGGFVATVWQRDNGRPRKVAVVRGSAKPNDRLILSAQETPPPGDLLPRVGFVVETKR